MANVTYKKKAELAYTKLILIVLAILLLFFLIMWIAKSTEWAGGILPKIFSVGR